MFDSDLYIEMKSYKPRQVDRKAHRSVYCITTGVTYRLISEAARASQISTMSIWSACIGKIPSAGKYNRKTGEFVKCTMAEVTSDVVKVKWKYL
jgi:hypothetical protein